MGNKATRAGGINEVPADVTANYTIAFETMLKKAQSATFRIVIGHYHLYSLEGDNPGNMISVVGALLNRYKVHAYFGGHQHDLEVRICGRYIAIIY